MAAPSGRHGYVLRALHGTNLRILRVWVFGVLDGGIRIKDFGLRGPGWERNKTESPEDFSGDHKQLFSSPLYPTKNDIETVSEDK